MDDRSQSLKNKKKTVSLADKILALLLLLLNCGCRLLNGENYNFQRLKGLTLYSRHR